jgi:solute carrier family 32 (vesicular inhibitory amino acid transporter)
LVVITIAVALLVPEFSLLTNLVGGFSNNLISIVLPPLFWLKLRGRERLGYVEIGWCVFVAEIGILAGAATTITTMIEIVKLF